MPSREPFRHELRAQLQQGIKRGATQLIVNAAELRRAVTLTLQSDQMQCCRDVMREEMRPGDSIMDDCERNGLTVRYLLPNGI